MPKSRKLPQTRRVATSFIGLVCSASIALAQNQSCVVPSAPQPLPDNLKKTVVITNATDPAVFTAGDFSLGRTLGNIIKTTPGMVDSQAERIALLSSLIRSFRITKGANGDVTLPITPRPQEAALDPIVLLNPSTGMKPVGLFNRFDLAPADFATCGEYRIVYAKDTANPPGGRFFLIFEAALDNPNPALGAEGCRPIVQFWDTLKTKVGNDLATSLERFYYEGTATPRIEPAIHFSNFGFPLGQIRGNLFVQPIWLLREWRISLSADGSPVFAPITVKSNPFPPLYKAEVATEDPKIKALRVEFQKDLIESRVSELVDVDRGGLGGNTEPASDLLFELSARFPGKFDAFESVSQGDAENPAVISTLDLKTKITQRLNQMGLGSACQLTQEHVLNRAGALSCGGCHQFTVGKPIALGVNWPNSVGFVHIDEGGALSDALNGFWLPARQKNLARHLQPAPAPPVPTPTGPNIRPGYPKNFQDIRQRAAAIRDSDNRVAISDSLAELEKQVQAARADERAMPGAFVSVRRPH